LWLLLTKLQLRFSHLHLEELKVLSQVWQMDQQLFLGLRQAHLEAVKSIVMSLALKMDCIPAPQQVRHHALSQG
jgi:hypothetical protein